MRRPALLAVLASVVASPAVADVAPYPTWRITADTDISAAVQVGGTVFVGGSFTRVGTGVPAFEGYLDLSTLLQTAPPGCATDAGRPVLPAADGAVALVAGSFVPFGTRLRDGAGPFVVADDVTHVRVNADCRFERRFALRLPGGAQSRGSAIDGNDGRLYFVASTASVAGVRFHVGAVDAVTGSLRAVWNAPPDAYAAELVGRQPDGRLAAMWTRSGGSVLGVFDPATGRFTDAVTLGAQALDVTTVGGRALVRTRPLGATVDALEMYDVATWQRLASWPQVDALSRPLVVRVGTRYVVSASSMRVDVGTQRRIAAFDAVTGAFDPSWTAPAWLDDTSVTVSSLVAAGSRVVLQGTFASGATRDSIAALDAGTGALDAWAFPYVATAAYSAGPTLYVGRITSTARVERLRMAAVDASTGALLPWAPSPPVSANETVSALVARDGFLYVAQGPSVRRYAVDTGFRDEAWRLDVSGGIGKVGVMAAGPAALYVSGGFTDASAGDGAPQSRAGGAAVTWAGNLTEWQPRVQGTCSARPSLSFPCVSSLVVAQGLVFMRGTVLPLNASLAPRSLGLFTLDTGALQPGTAPVSALADDGDVVYAVSSTQVLRVDPGLQVRAVAPAEQAGPLGARSGFVYAAFERDGTTGQLTGNAYRWGSPLGLASGMLDGIFSRGVAFHPEIEATAPGPPLALTSFASGARVTFRWTRSAADLQPLGAPPPAHGTAPTSHVITASLTSGGPSIASLETGSSDTEFALDAPPGTYFVCVQAKNRFGKSAPSNEVRVDVTPAAPDAPLATVATVTGTTARIAWTAAVGGWPAIGYRLEAGRSPGASDIGVIAVSATEITVPGVPPGRYYVRVRAVNASGASAAGSEVVIDVP